MATDSQENYENEDGGDMSDEEGGIRVEDIYIPPPPKAACSFENTGPRLIITHIVNNFFKSYGKNIYVGPFHKCFNGIVGPNGSGKSNVIDSLLFVFGYRANRIRSKKISVLIHNSETFPNINSCTVEVHFVEIIDKDGEDYEIIPGTEFTVSRTAHKDNSSYYTINNRRVQFKEVATLLRKHAIDLDHNRFLILQGEVEQISLMNPKGSTEHETGMLEFLEDIIGTTRYKEPLNKLKEKLEVLEEHRLAKVNRLKLVENEFSELEEPMKEAVSFLKLENVITQKKNLLYQKHIAITEEQLEEAKEKNADITKAEEELLNKMKTLHAEKKEKEETLKARTENYSHLKKRKEELKQAYDKASNFDTQIAADMDHINKNRKKNKQLLAEECEKLEEFKQMPEKSVRDIADYEKRAAELAETVESLEAEKAELLANLRQETAHLQEKKASLQNDLLKLNQTVDEKKSEFSIAEKELKLCISNEEREKNKLETLRQTAAEQKATIEELTQKIELLKTKIPATERSLNEALRELQEVKAKEAQLREKLMKKRSKVEESKSSMQASKSRGRVLDALMKQKRDGNCPGLFGRLGDLGAIDQKYDVAISTACGALDNIIVDTVETAVWCIEFLKQNDIGRGTFIALEKQEHLRRYTETEIQTPENIPRLFDLIRVDDERVKTAFYYALRDTLVAKDLDQGSRIAYGAQRYRVVTLAGQLFETSGTMSGGGNSVMRGRMGQSVAVSTNQPVVDIAAMEEELNNLYETVKGLRQQQTQLEQQVNILQPELRNMNVEFDKSRIELEALKKQYPLTLNQLKEQESKASNTKSDKKEVERLTKIVEEKKAAFEEAFEGTSELKKKVDAISKEIKEKTTGKMNAIDKKISTTSKTLDKCQSEITRLKVAAKSAEANAKKSQKKIETLENEIKTAENSLIEMKGKRTEIETDVKNLLTVIKEINEKLEEGEEEYSTLKEEVSAITKSENKLKAEKIEIDQKVKKFKQNLEMLQAEILQWRARVSKLKLQEIPLEPSTETLKTYENEELAQHNIESIQKIVHTQEEQLKTLKPNLNIIAEYKKKMVVLQERMQELNELTDRKAIVKKHFDDLKDRRKCEFVLGFNIIRKKLKETFQTITFGGDADLEMVDSFDPFTEGVKLNIRPPRKAWTDIPNLSGGEKTLSSLSLVFALHYFKPSPIYVMDEIDSALDFKNSSIIANYIKERTKNGQFLLISLRSEMVTIVHRLVGIYKTYGTTKSITYNPYGHDVSNNKENMANNNDAASQSTAQESACNTEMEDSFEAASQPNGSLVVDDSFDNTSQKNGTSTIDESMLEEGDEPMECD